MRLTAWTTVFILLGCGGTKEPIRSPLEAREAACTGGDAQACSETGLAWMDGQGVPRDMARGVVFYEKACTLKNADACFLLGVVRDLGDGVPIDEARARQYYRQACDLHNPPACMAIEEMDRNIPRFPFRGEKWRSLEEACHRGGARGCLDFYKEACAQGEAEGCYTLGAILQLGVAFAEQDPVQARLYFGKACELGHAPGCCMLERIWRTGDGVERDDARADDYLKLIQTQGYDCGSD